MTFRLFRRSANDTVIDRLYLRVVDASRQRELFADLGVPDTFEGRFESLVLHLTLALRRLRRCEAPGPDIAQHLVDTAFRHFDRTLREMGVGDTVVPKRMKTLAEAFLGRGTAYEEALKGAPEDLAACLRRNVYTGRREADDLARYVREAEALLADTSLQAFIDGQVAFPDPTPNVTEIMP